MSSELEAFTRATRRARIIKIGLVGLVVLSPLIWVVWKTSARKREIADRHEQQQIADKLSPADVERGKADVANLRAFLDTDRKEFAAAFAPDALAALAPMGGKCRHTLPVPTEDKAGDSASKYHDRYGRIDPNYFGELEVTVIDDPSKAKPAVLGTFAAIVGDVEAGLANGKATKTDLTRVAALTRRQYMDLIVVGKSTDAVVGVSEFLPATLTGMAYLYDHVEGRIVCATAVDVTSSQAVVVQYTGQIGGSAPHDKVQETLKRDLHIQLRYAVAATLRALL